MGFAGQRGRLTGIRGILFDRDGTLVVDDPPYNGDPRKVRLMPTAAAALDAARTVGPVGVVSNQSGLARGLLTTSQVDAVNARVTELLGPFDTVRWCPHAPADKCWCRKPAPRLILQAAGDLGLPAANLAVIGDIGSDVQAATSAGAVGILVPTAKTLPAEVAAAALCAPNLLAAVELVLRATASSPRLQQAGALP